MTFWEGFSKYCGIQGLIAIILVGGYIVFTACRIPIDNLYTNVMTLVIGFYFAKNGVGIIDAIAKATKREL